ncbi:poly-gamma-glutamate system protein [Rhodopirellula sp. JC740]|uniref:Poly-gamma-glutamate system protein n=1 Tax=Rhodopirellula halodulae TaxID=2894198 RepID=A0ABS8NHQ4_9BACT|nr:poly-gamma-glutamate system protein [Rhodopirellula sp. JC740]MCC9643075.1 poly-gamma-glutamate system protein [Rhodopirellula sp. JC740]
MKKLYYRPQKISSGSLLFLAALSVVTVLALRALPSNITGWSTLVAGMYGIPDLKDRMLEASLRAETAFDAIHCRRVEMGHPLLDAQDPADTGMVGPSMSVVTTLPGHLAAKQTSINPNFAAVAMRLLVDAGVRPGDRVAIGCTGSFPALNIAVYSAAESLGARPTIISSAASSQFGANSPDMMWPDMEKLLFDEGILSFRSLETSRGGFRDRAAGMSDDTRAVLEAAIERSGVPLMDSEDDADAIERRMLAYSKAAEDETYAVYINVGGGDASVGGTEGNDSIGEGLIYPKQLATIQKKASSPEAVDCVATRFLASGVPVINMINVVALANQYGLPIASTTKVEVGQGAVFTIIDPRRLLALLGIFFITAATAVVVKPPHRLTKWLQSKGWYGEQTKDQPQYMV